MVLQRQLQLIILVLFPMVISQTDCADVLPFYITFDKSCNISSDDFCPNSPHKEQNERSIDNIKLKVDGFKPNTSNTECLNAIKDTYCVTRFGECVQNVKGFNLATLKNKCGLNSLAENGCSDAVQIDMNHTDCVLLSTEMLMRINGFKARTTCSSRSTKQSDVCSELNLKVLEAENNVEGIEKSLGNLKGLEVSEEERSCHKSVIKILCDARGPLCSDDNKYIGHVVNKEDCLQQLECLNSSLGVYTTLSQICSDLPSSEDPKTDICIIGRNATEKPIKTKATLSPSIFEQTIVSTPSLKKETEHISLLKPSIVVQTNETLVVKSLEKNGTQGISATTPEPLLKSQELLNGTNKPNEDKSRGKDNNSGQRFVSTQFGTALLFLCSLLSI